LCSARDSWSQLARRAASGVRDNPAAVCRAAAFKNFLPLAFAVAFVIALSWPWLGRKVIAPEVCTIACAAPMLLSPLPTAAALHAHAAWLIGLACHQGCPAGDTMHAGACVQLAAPALHVWCGMSRLNSACQSDRGNACHPERGLCVAVPPSRHESSRSLRCQARRP
jgi:hypothetical protein